MHSFLQFRPFFCALFNNVARLSPVFKQFFDVSIHVHPGWYLKYCPPGTLRTTAEQYQRAEPSSLLEPQALSPFFGFMPRPGYFWLRIPKFYTLSHRNQIPNHFIHYSLFNIFFCLSYCLFILLLFCQN